MTDYTVLPTTDSLRSLMADTQHMAAEVLHNYQTQLGQNPTNQSLKEVAETIQRLKIELTFREASFANLFTEPDSSTTDPNYSNGDHCRCSNGIPLKTYTTSRSQAVTNVTVSTFKLEGSTTRWLDPRHDLTKHSPKDLQWGGGKPRNSLQLALAILADFAGDEYALVHHETLSHAVLQHLPHHGWTITADQLAGWVKDHPMPNCNTQEESPPQLSLINI